MSFEQRFELGKRVGQAGITEKNISKHREQLTERSQHWSVVSMSEKKEARHCGEERGKNTRGNRRGSVGHL